MIPAIVSTLIFLIMLVVVFTEKINRTIASIAASSAMVLAGKIFGFYSEEQALNSIDFNTLGLLLGMMILVALLEPTGFFQFLAVWAGRFSKGNPVRLLILLGTVTTLLSMFLDNVTTAILIAPVTVLICEIIGLSPIPYLMAEALLSNTGGVATLIGDPPNVLIASASGLTFNDFLTHSLPVVLVAWIVALVIIRYLFRQELSHKPEGIQAVLKLKPMESLHDRVTATRALIVLDGALILFFFHSALHISPSFVALTAAAAGLTWVKPPIKETFNHVEWDVLIFFAALFIVVGGLESAGVLHVLTSLLDRVSHIPAPFFGIFLLWLAAGVSAIVDNVPFTIALIPVIQELEASGIEVHSLWWALAFGAGFGGNATIIGSTANIIVVSLSERTRTPIRADFWIRRGLPVMLATCTVASIFYLLFFPMFSR